MPQQTTEFGRTLYGMMLDHGVEQRQELAHLLAKSGFELTSQTISNYMNGKRHRIDPAFFEAVAKVLDLSDEEQRRLTDAYLNGGGAVSAKPVEARANGTQVEDEDASGGARNLESILAAVAAGEIHPDEAASRLRQGEVRYLDEYAVLDAGRAVRKGVPEVVYAPGKTPEQVAGICAVLLEGNERVIVSGPTDDHVSLLRERLPLVPVRRAGRAVVVGGGSPPPTGGRIVAIGAGTSDLPVLEEAVAVAGEMGVEVRTFHDVGVAALHRLAGPLAELRAFDPDCVVVAAGMEGALPTVVSGLVAVPVVGLPTSTGYGLGGDGTAAILGMLQSCSPGLSVVNVDNGVGAGATAALIANRAASFRATTPANTDTEPDPDRPPSPYVADPSRQ